MLTFGLIGCGKHAQWAVLPSFAASPGCRLAAVADIAADGLAFVTDPAIARYTDAGEMLRRERLDAVYVATPCETHAALTCTALEAGCHVLCEKPMAMSEAECRRMLSAAASAGRQIFIDFETRYIAGHEQVRRWIADGRIGAVRAVHIESLWDGHKVTGPVSERRKGFLQRSGCLDCGVHKLDLARFYCGGGEWRDITARGAWCGESVRFPPHISIMGRLTPGVLVTLTESFAWTARIPARHHRESLAVLGEKGVIVLEPGPDHGAVLRLVSDSATEEAPMSEAGHALVIPRVLADMVSVIEGGRPVPPSLATGTDGLMAQIALDAANRCAVEAGDVSPA